MNAAIHHISIICTERNLAFYRALGFKESFRKVRANDTIVLMDGCGIRLEFFVDPSHPSHKSGADEPVGLRHFALEFDDTIENVINRLKSSFDESPEIGPITEDWNGTRFCFIKDFDGIPVEFKESDK